MLLIVDMQNDFCKKNGALYIGDHVQATLSNIHSLAQDFDSNNIMFTRDVHQEDDPEFTRFEKHCVEGSPGSEYHFSMQHLRIMKGIEEGKSEILKSNFFLPISKGVSIFPAAGTITIVGVCTDICVMHIAFQLFRFGFTIEIVEDCVTSFDLEAHAWAIKHMKNIMGLKII